MCNRRLSWLKYTINNSTINRSVVQQKESIRFHRHCAIYGYDSPRILNKGLLDRWAGCVLCSRTSYFWSARRPWLSQNVVRFSISRSYRLLRSARGDSNSVCHSRSQRVSERGRPDKKSSLRGSSYGCAIDKDGKHNFFVRNKLVNTNTATKWLSFGTTDKI